MCVCVCVLGVDGNVGAAAPANGDIGDERQCVQRGRSARPGREEVCVGARVQVHVGMVWAWMELWVLLLQQLGAWENRVGG